MLTGKILTSRERQDRIIVCEKEPFEFAYVIQPKLAVASVVATLPHSRTTLHGVEDAGNEEITWQKSTVNSSRAKGAIRCKASSPAPTTPCLDTNPARPKIERQGCERQEIGTCRGAAVY